MPSRWHCGTGTSLGRGTTTSNCRTTVWKRTTQCCRSSSSWHGRPVSPWQPPTTPIICAGKMPECRRSCSASRLARPFRMQTGWNFRPMNSTSRPPMRCTSCSLWCRRRAKILQRSQNSAILISSSGTPRSRITKRRTAWTIRRILKNSAGKVWSAATDPTCRRQTGTVSSMRSVWSRPWATPTIILSSGIISTTPKVRAFRWVPDAAPVPAASPPTAWASRTSTLSGTT